ncbi:MAG: sulfurtransferase [Phycisphaerae bacterium]
MRMTTINVLAAVLLGALAGCGPGRVGDGFVLEPEKFDQQYVAFMRHERPMVILDVRPRDRFEAGRVKGAVWVDNAEWTRLSRENGGLGDAAAWRQRIGTLGIEDDTPVLIYDGGELKEASRVWFILQLAGCENVAILNGGYPAIREMLPGRIAQRERAAPATRRFEIDDDAEPTVALAEKDRVRSVVETGTAAVIDGRTPNEYSGKDTRNNPRAGHLPGAASVPHESLMADDGRLRAVRELRQAFKQAGLDDDDREIVVHCDGGGRAALVALAAARCGYDHVANYYMSFGEWAGDDTCPLVSPQNAE